MRRLRFSQVGIQEVGNESTEEVGWSLHPVRCWTGSLVKLLAADVQEGQFTVQRIRDSTSIAGPLLLQTSYRDIKFPRMVMAEHTQRVQLLMADAHHIRVKCTARDESSQLPHRMLSFSRRPSNHRPFPVNSHMVVVEVQCLPIAPDHVADRGATRPDKGLAHHHEPQILHEGLHRRSPDRPELVGHAGCCRPTLVEALIATRTEVYSGRCAVQLCCEHMLVMRDVLRIIAQQVDGPGAGWMGSISEGPDAFLVL